MTQKREGQGWEQGVKGAGIKVASGDPGYGQGQGRTRRPLGRWVGGEFILRTSQMPHGKMGYDYPRPTVKVK